MWALTLSCTRYAQLLMFSMRLSIVARLCFSWAKLALQTDTGHHCLLAVLSLACPVAKLVEPVQISGARDLQRGLEDAGRQLVPLTDSNPVDIVWQDRPAAPQAPIRVHPAQHAGESVPEKLARMRQELQGASWQPARPDTMAGVGRDLPQLHDCTAFGQNRNASKQW